MDTVVALVVAGFLGLAGVALAVAIRRSRAFREAVRHTAEVFGLGFEPGGLIRSPRAKGAVDGLAVEVRHVRLKVRRRGADSDPVLYTRIRVSGGWGKDLSAHAREVRRRLCPRRGFRDAFNDALGGAEELATGDPGLDRAVVLRTSRRFDALSRLGADTRDGLRAIVGGGHGDVRDGAVAVNRRRLVTDPRALEALTGAAIALGRDLSRGGRPAEPALADIVAGDPLAAPRITALEQLLHERPSHPETGRAVAAALAAGDPALRVLAASVAGAAGFDAAREVAAQVDAPLATRRTALELLGSRYPERRPEAAAAIDGVLPAAGDDLLDAALDAAAALGHSPELARLAALGPRVGANSAPAYARALAAHGPAAEPPLLALLAVDHGEVKAAAAQGLGRVAGLGAVEPLLPHTAGVFRSRRLKAAARDAVAAIQARAGGAAAGALSLADGAGGALSLSDDAETR